MSVKLYLNLVEYDYEAGASWSISLNQGSSGNVTVRIDETHPLPAINLIATFEDESAPNAVYAFNIAKVMEKPRLTEDSPRQATLTLQSLASRLSFCYPVVNFQHGVSGGFLVSSLGDYAAQCFPFRVQLGSGVSGTYAKFVSTKNTIKQILDKVASDFGGYVKETIIKNSAMGEGWDAYHAQIVVSSKFFTADSNTRDLDLTAPFEYFSREWRELPAPHWETVVKKTFFYDYKHNDSNQYYCNRIKAYGAVNGRQPVEISFNLVQQNNLSYAAFMETVKQGIDLPDAIAYQQGTGEMAAVYDPQTGSLSTFRFEIGGPGEPERKGIWRVSSENRKRLNYNPSQWELPEDDGSGLSLPRYFFFNYIPRYNISITIDNEEEQQRTNSIVQRNFDIPLATDFLSFEQQARERLAIFSRPQWTISFSAVINANAYDAMNRHYRVTDAERTYSHNFYLRKMQAKVNQLGEVVATWELTQQPLFTLSETFSYFNEGVDEGAIYGETAWALGSDTLRFSEEMQAHEPMLPYVGANGMEPVVLDWLGGYASDD